MVAKLIKTIPNKAKGGSMKLFRVSPPVNYRDGEETNYLIVSAIPSAFDTGNPETYIFPANKKGEIVSWGELEGSYRGGMSHEKALLGLGYEIKK
jgi:hypothetical protein